MIIWSGNLRKMLFLLVTSRYEMSCTKGYTGASIFSGKFYSMKSQFLCVGGVAWENYDGG